MSFRGLTSSDDDTEAAYPTSARHTRVPLSVHVRAAYVWLCSVLMWLADSFSHWLARLQPLPSVRVNHSLYTVVKPLGEGGFSFVYLVKDVNAQLFAMKKVRLELDEQKDRFDMEVANMRKVNSDNVVKLVDSAVVDGSGIILMKFYKNGTLQDLIDKTPPTEFIPLKLILHYAIDICSGLLAFHKLDPPHAFRDLKPANVLLDDQDNAVLMDLGSVAPARIRISTRRDAVAVMDLAQETVTAPYRAPELFDPPTNSTIDERTDSWALGCTIFALAYKQSPFDGTMTAAVGGKIPFPSTPDPYGKAFRTLLQMILVTDIKTRPTVDQILVKLKGLQSSLVLDAGV